MRLITIDDMANMINSRLSSLAASHHAEVDPVVLHPGTLMAHTHIRWGDQRAHLQFPIEPIGTFDQHRTDQIVESKFHALLALMREEKAG